MYRWQHRKVANGKNGISIMCYLTDFYDVFFDISINSTHHD